MSEHAIIVEELSMRFRMEQRHYGIKNMILHLPQYVRDLKAKNDYVALDNISFSIMKGERVGLVGHNGSGKTTLLSVIGGVYRRYSGRVTVNGRMSMMLALGAGFCPELSGRENVILNGVLQGMTRDEMLERIDSIIEFADVGPYIDAPVFQYSSGMQARLGFAIATAINPEILLVDEVMAVGDAEFSVKCEKRMTDLMETGTTLILVSHNTADIRRYCNRVIKLSRGKIVADGPVSEVLNGD